jgi:serine/threonine-protein kinase
VQAPLSLDCHRCKLPILPETISGEEKSLLLATLHCRCHKSNTSPNTANPSRPKPISVYSSHCRNCGKKLITTSDKKVLTNLFFKPYTCHCQNLEPQTDETSLEDQLSWQFHLKSQAQTRKRTRFENKALSKTKLVLSASDRRALIELKPGELIGNTYILEEQIGEGGMALVFKARHRLLGRLCALKFLAPSAISPQSWEFFKREAKILNDLSHPAISVIYDMGLHKNALPFIAMELLQGTTLEELLVKENTLCLGAALEIFVQVAGALSYAHRQKIIHKDIKPANIMLTLAPSRAVSIKLLDFGIAELEDKNYLAANANDDDDDDNDEADIIGSACYMSPEQFSGEKLTAATDIYSLGCSLFECLTGTLPFNGEEYDEMEEKHKNQPAPTLKAVTNSDFPLEIEAVLHKALQKEPARRYRYISEMVVDLERILEGKPLQFAKTEEFLAAQGNSQNTNNRSNNIYTEALVAASLLICIPAFAIWKILNKETILQAGANYEIADDLASSHTLKNSVLVPSPGKALKGKASEKRLEEVPRKAHQLTLSGPELDKLYEAGGLSPATQIKGPLSKIVHVNGVKKRVFTFPATYSLGYIAEGCFSPPEQAIGKKIYPASSPIAFYADPSLGDNPEVYKYFDNKAINFLSVIRATKLPEAKVLSKWQNLHILRFRKCIITLAYFKALKTIPQLSVLMLDQNEFNNQDLIDSKLLNTIQALDLVARGENNLNFLNVLQSLERAPQQPDLTLCGQISKEETASLSRLKKMKKLSLKDTRLTDNQLTLLCQMQFLKELTIDKTCLSDCSSGAIAQLRQSLSGKTQVSIVESQTQE